MGESPASSRRDAPVAARLARPGELHALVGKRIGVGRWREIDQATVDRFAEITGDSQWIHVDRERAAAGPFGTTVAHGFLTLALCAPILEETLEIEGVAMRVNYGLDRVRFPAPVPTGSSVRGIADLVSAREVGGAVEAVLRVAIEVAGASKPACVADVVLRLYR